MNGSEQLRELLISIRSNGYKAYKSIQGTYDFRDYTLIVDHVQGDPYAQPSRVRIRVDRERSGYFSNLSEGKSREIAFCDYLTRRFADACDLFCQGIRGSGKSGLIGIDRPGQEILERSAMVLTYESIEARFFIGLPATGRTVDITTAVDMIFKELPNIATHTFFLKKEFCQDIYHHVELSEDADYLRNQLKDNGLIGFIAEGAVLPRESGIDPKPLISDNAVPFVMPVEYAVEFQLPNAGSIHGMGIPEGVTLIVGGGFHGKSTLLKALETGIYNHIPGDGREHVVSRKETVKIRASDGRNITKTDISAFINNLPNQKDTRIFSTSNASGSTSQAANVTESIEAGAEVLLLDEDTSATNFMIRDSRMQALVTDQWEPISPFISKIRSMYRDLGISTVIVMGGSGDYFSEADHVIQMKHYQPVDVTKEAKAIADRTAGNTGLIKRQIMSFPSERVPEQNSFNPFRNDGKFNVRATRSHEIIFGEEVIEFPDVEQLVSTSQTRAVAYAIHYAGKYLKLELPLKSLIEQIVKDIETDGFDILTPWIRGDLASFRSLDLAAVINRTRSLIVSAP